MSCYYWKLQIKFEKVEQIQNLKAWFKINLKIKLQTRRKRNTYFLLFNFILLLEPSENLGHIGLKHKAAHYHFIEKEMNLRK